MTEQQPAPDAPVPEPEWRLELAGRIDQLIGWAKSGKIRGEYYLMDAENTDRLRDDILAALDRILASVAFEEARNG